MTPTPSDRSPDGSEPSRRSPRRVVIADDMPVIRRMLALALHSEPGVELVGEAENGAEAVELAKTHRPDAIIMDHQMPVMNGVEAVREIRRAAFAVSIVMFSSDPTVERDAFDAGVDAFFLKGEVGPFDLVDFLVGAPADGHPGTVGHAVAQALGSMRPANADGPDQPARTDPAPQV